MEMGVLLIAKIRHFLYAQRMQLNLVIVFILEK